MFHYYSGWTLLLHAKFCWKYTFEQKEMLLFVFSEQNQKKLDISCWSCFSLNGKLIKICGYPLCYKIRYYFKNVYIIFETDSTKSESWFLTNVKKLIEHKFSKQKCRKYHRWQLITRKRNLDRTIKRNYTEKSPWRWWHWPWSGPISKKLIEYKFSQ